MVEKILNIKRKIAGIKSHERIKSATSNMQSDFSGNIPASQNQGKYMVDRINFLEKELDRSQEEAFQAGFQEGKDRAVKEADSRVEEFKALSKSFEKQYLLSFEKLEKPLLHVAKKMAEKILDREIDEANKGDSIFMDTFLMEKLKQLLYEVVDQVKIIIQVNPIHLEWLASPGIEKELNLPKTTDISFIGDENLKPGECLIKTEDYYIDNTYGQQLNQLVQNLATEERRWNN